MTVIAAMKLERTEGACEHERKGDKKTGGNDRREERGCGRERLTRTFEIYNLKCFFLLTLILVILDRQTNQLMESNIEMKSLHFQTRTDLCFLPNLWDAFRKYPFMQYAVCKDKNKGEAHQVDNWDMEIRKGDQAA